VLCLEHPWDTRVTRLTVRGGGLETFSGPPQHINLAYPWGVQLTDGERCIAVQGTHDNFNGKVIDYACGPGYDHVLLRPLNRSSSRWTYQSAFAQPSGTYRPGPPENVATAWYASPDNGAASDARTDDCTATALAFAAQAYEAAHGNPDGVLPDLNAQACDAGYAEIVFTQSAPPIGYNATIAFKATAAGWQEIGSSDFIQPGEFGIPFSVAKAINNALRKSPQTEQVPF
jgi:hypothetical protein